jgi:hypothetical protein
LPSIAIVLNTANNNKDKSLILTKGKIKDDYVSCFMRTIQPRGVYFCFCCLALCSHNDSALSLDSQNRFSPSFSYNCNMCGSHGHFNFVDSCVVKIGDKFYKRTDDMYGGVEIGINPAPITDENDPSGERSKKKARKMVVAYHEQFREMAPVEEESLYATKIYCNGGDGTSSLAPQIARAKDMMQARANMVCSPVEPDERNCVPRGVMVLDAVKEDDIASLPKARELSPKSTDHKEKENNKV